MSEKEKMLAGKIYDPTDEELVRLRTKAHRLSQHLEKTAMPILILLYWMYVL